MLRSTLIVGVILVLETTAHARCRRVSPEEQVERSAAVFLGVASSPRRVEGTLWEWTVYTYASWKGPQQPTRVRADRTWQRRPRKGQRADGDPPMPIRSNVLQVFYANWDDGQLYVRNGRCSSGTTDNPNTMQALGAPQWRRVSTQRIRNSIRRHAEDCADFEAATHLPNVLRVRGCSENLLPAGAYLLQHVTKRGNRVTFRPIRPSDINPYASP